MKNGQNCTTFLSQISDAWSSRFWIARRKKSTSSRTWTIRPPKSLSSSCSTLSWRTLRSSSVQASGASVQRKKTLATSTCLTLRNSALSGWITRPFPSTVWRLWSSSTSWTMSTSFCTKLARFWLRNGTGGRWKRGFNRDMQKRVLIDWQFLREQSKYDVSRLKCVFCSQKK